MKRPLILMLSAACIVLSLMAKDLLVQLKSGREARISLEQIKEVKFDMADDDVLPDDPYPSAVDFTQRVMLMQHTGTRCVHCPLVISGLRNLAADETYGSRFTLAALHSYQEDPMGNDIVREVSNVYRGMNGWPFVNPGFSKEGTGASTNIAQQTDRLRDLVDGAMENTTPSGISSTATLDGSDIKLTLVMKAGEMGEYRVGAFLIEDGVKADQMNSHTDVTGDADFSIHNNVVRTVVGRDSEGGFTGIDVGMVRRGETAYTSQIISLASGWNRENCRLLIYVTEKLDGKYVLVNSAYAPIDGTAHFEYDSQAPATDQYVTLSKSLVEVKSEGGQFSVPFTLANGADASKIQLSANVEWLTGIKIVGSEVRFTVSENSVEDRNGRISLSYDGARPIDISVRQSSKTSEEGNLFLIETEIQTPYAAMVTFTPNGYTGNYVFLVAKAEVVDRYINAGNISGWIEGDLDFFGRQAESAGLTLSEYLSRMTNLYGRDGKPVTITYSDLSPDTEYYAYCYGMTLDGEVTTEFYKKSFRTVLVDRVNLSLTSNVTDITKNTATINVTPSNNDNSYFWTYVSAMDWAKYDLNFIMDNMVLNVMDLVNHGADINNIIHKGPSSEDVKGLWAGTEYHIVGWGMDNRGTPTTVPSEIGTFTTLKDDLLSECTFAVDCPEVTDKDIKIHVKPTDNAERYYVAAIDENTCFGYDADQMATRIINMENERFGQGFYGDGVNWGNAKFIMTGEQTVWGRQDLDWTFSPQHTYNIYVFGVNAQGVRTTAVATKTVTTPKAPESDMTIDIVYNPDQSDWQYGSFTFKPSKNDEYYLPLLVETSELQYVTNPDGTLNEVAICEEMEHYYDDSPNYYTMQGERTRQFRWVPERDYTMLVCGWSGGNTTRFFRYDVHTPSIGLGESSADVDCKWELFDATELSKLDYDRWKDYSGMVVIRLQFTPNADADFYCGGVWAPKSNYADVGEEAYLITLDMNPDVSIVNRPNGMYRTLNYGLAYSLSYFAKDKDGKFGPFHYVEFTPTAGDNITPAYDFWSTPSGMPEKILVMNSDGSVKDITAPKMPGLLRKAEGTRIAAGNKKATASKVESLGRN